MQEEENRVRDADSDTENDILEAFSDSRSYYRSRPQNLKCTWNMKYEQQTNNNHCQEYNAYRENGDGEWCEFDEPSTIFEFKEQKGVKVDVDLGILCH